MAKTSMIERQKKRQRMVAQYATRRAALKAIAEDDQRPMEERFRARLKLAKLPRNSCPTRLNRRCEVSGRSRSYYRKFSISRIALRDLALRGQLPGMRKSSW